MKIKWETYIKETLASASFCIRFCLNVSIWCVGLQIGFSLVSILIPFLMISCARELLNLLASSTIASGVTPEVLGLLTYLCIYYCILSWLQKASESWNIYIRGLFQSRLERANKLQIMQKAAALHQKCFDRPEFYDSVQDVSYSGTIIVQTALQYVDIVRYFCAFIVSFVLLARWNLVAALCATAAAIPMIVLQNKQVRAVYSLQWEQYPEERRMNYASSLAYRRECAPELRIYGFDPFLKSKYLHSWDTIYYRKKRVSGRYTVLHTIVSILPEIVSAVILVCIGRAVLDGRSTLGDFSYYQGVLSQILGNVQMLIITGAMVLDGKLRVGKYKEFLRQEEETSGEKPVSHNGNDEIEFRHVSFRYGEDLPYVLQDVSFRFRSGEKVALVGENGSGKTTLLKLLLRLYDPTEGVILFNGVSLKDLDLKQYRSQFGAVLQGYFNYAFTVRESVALSEYGEARDTEKIHTALSNSTAAEFVDRLPSREETPLTREFYEDGVELSGGQWQKIALARAFFRTPDICVLDEPSSALDASAEEEMFTCLSKLSEGKTTVTVTHRLANIKEYDRILVFKEGKLVESGTHEDLMKLHGQYEYLYSLQARRYE